MTTSFDTIIIGGSYAGLSAALALGRSKRNVLIIDNGKPGNRQTPHAHNLLTRDGEAPEAITKIAKNQVLAYPTIKFKKGTAISATGADGLFEIVTDDHEIYNAKKLLFATGIRDIPMDIEGFSACWGISILHCPYCHGYEVREEPLGIISNGDLGFEFAKLIYNWSQHLTLFTNGPSTLTSDQLIKLTSKKIAIIEKKIASIEHHSGILEHIVFTDNSKYPLKAIFARGGTEPHSNLPTKIGCEQAIEGPAKGLIKIDSFGKTNIPGIYAAGDNSSPMRSLSVAMSSGTTAGAFINHELINDSF